MADSSVHAYYTAAMAGLRFLEHRQPSGRRFGPDADLLWGSFQGHLQDIDRVELLLRDADAQWPGSMGARRVFAREGVPDDDAFGKDWASLDPQLGHTIWREANAAPAAENLAAALSRVADAWGLSLSPVATDVTPSSRIVAAGPSAIAALAEAFEGRSELDWADQVVVVATAPGPRQLAAFCGAALNVVKAQPVLLSANEARALAKGYVALVAGDAAAEDAAWARALTGRGPTEG